MHSSYRRLPHHYAIAEPLFVTFRLQRQSAKRQGVSQRAAESGKAFACLDRLLDEQRAGPAYLRMPAIAEVVADAIGQGTASGCLLHAWVVMPNHVHLLITPQVEVPALLRRLKGTSARESNKLLGQTGRPFWQDESYDRLRAECQRIPTNRELYPPKPGASRARSIGRGIPMVEYLEAGRAEARCRLKPAPHIL